jgi:tetratricopeptide (TPR) repeat protein
VLKNSIQKIGFSFILIGVIFFPRMSLAEDFAPAKAETSSSTMAANTNVASISTSTQDVKAAKKVKEIAKQATQIQNSFLDRNAEWRFLKEEPLPKNKRVALALARAVSLFIAANPQAAEAPKAWALLAFFERSAGDNKSALVAYLHLIYEYPKATETLEAQSNFLALAKKTLGRDLMPGWQELATPLESSNKDQRLASMLERLSKDTGGLLRKPAWREFMLFEFRFPSYRNSDDILLSLAQIFEQDSRPNEALVFFRELLSAYPTSLYAPDAQFQIAFLHERLGDYQQAVGSYQKLITDYPQNRELQPALESLAALFSQKLSQWTLAIQTDQKIVKLFPNTQASHKALENAIYSSKKLSDFKGEANFLVELAVAFPQTREASISLYHAAGIYYERVRDAAQAEKLYQQYLSCSGSWYDPASWWRRHRARHRLSILAPANAPKATGE